MGWSWEAIQSKRRFIFYVYDTKIRLMEMNSRSSLFKMFYFKI